MNEYQIDIIAETLRELKQGEKHFALLFYAFTGLILLVLYFTLLYLNFMFTSAIQCNNQCRVH